MLMPQAATPPSEQTTNAAATSTKIAYIMSRFPRVTETFILYEILELVRRGVAVEVYPLIRERTAVKHPEVDQVMPLARFQPLVSLPILWANLYFLCRHPIRYFKTLTKVLTRTAGSARFFIGALGILPKSVRFAYEMKVRGVEHIHAHFAHHPALAAFVCNQLTSIPFSFTAHGSDIHMEQRSIDLKIAAAKFAVMISDYNKRFLIEKFGPHIAPKMHVVRCGIDPEVFVPRSESPKKSRPFEILCVASMREVKGHRYLVEACRILKDRGLPFNCHLIGDGPRLEEIQGQVAAAGLQKLVVFHGAQPRPVVLERMRSADVLVLPSVLESRGRREGIPVTLMEAMACGLPVVSSDLSGIPELVTSGEHGLLTKPADSPAIADALEQLAKSPELCRRYGAAGREKVIAEYNLKTNIAKLVRLLLGGTPSTYSGTEPTTPREHECPDPAPL